MLSTGWGIAVAVVLPVGSAVAMIRSRGAGARHDDQDRDVADPRSEGGPDDGGHGRVRPEETSLGSRPAIGDEDVDVQAVGLPLRQPMQDDELLRATGERVTQGAP